MLRVLVFQEGFCSTEFDNKLAWFDGCETSDRYDGLSCSEGCEM
jgi:hypothetical protein